jgi:hypothetical protein
LASFGVHPLLQGKSVQRITHAEGARCRCRGSVRTLSGLGPRGSKARVADRSARKPEIWPQGRLSGLMRSISPLRFGYASGSDGWSNSYRFGQLGAP